MKLIKHSMVLLVCGLLAACGTAGTGASPSAQPAPADTQATAAPAAAATSAGETTASGDQIQLRVAWWGSQNRHDRTLKVIELFEKSHPNIKIVSEYSNFDDYWTKLSTQAAGGNLPDVVQHDYSRIGEWVSQSLLLPLDPYVSDGTIKLEDVADEQLSGGRVGGKIYGISLGTNALTVLYDPAKFKAAGLEAPTADWTWTDFQKSADTIHQKLGIYGVEGFYNIEMLKLYLKERGKWIYNDQGTGLGYTDDSQVAAFFQLLLDMQASGAMPTREFDAARGTPSLEESLIVSEKSAMLFTWSNQAVAVANAVKGRELALVQTPRLDGGSESLYLKPSMFFAIPAKSKNAAAAAQFIDFFLNSPEANQILAAERGVPIIPAVRTAIKTDLPPMQQQVFKYIAEVEAVAAPINPPDPPTHAKIVAEVYNPLIDQLLYGEISAEDAAAQLRTQVSAILAGK
ncbi:extracellular solute-binding protein [Chloroflexia bacterium SDU3-3]|nr:extracellular solute-binding protein [Chloroflexia bacterium SDU3-3]